MVAAGDPSLHITEYGDLPNAQPYPTRRVPDEPEEGLDDADIEETERVLQETIEAPVEPPAHRHAPRPTKRRLQVEDAGPSPWERPRDGFTSAMTARADARRPTTSTDAPRAWTEQSLSRPRGDEPRPMREC